MQNGTALMDTPKDLITFDEDKVALIKRTIAPTATHDELALFLHQCQRTGLDPLARQIYFQKYQNHRTGRADVTIITGIDGYRLVADRTGRYAGNSEPVYGEYAPIHDDNRIEAPISATVTVKKIVQGVICEFSATAYWSEYYPGGKRGHMWRRMPHVMIAKCSEALALRKAFPADLSGVYTREEMEQANQEPPMPVTTTQEIIDQVNDDLFGDNPPERPNGINWRARLAGTEKPTLGTVASIAANAFDHYDTDHHTLNAMQHYTEFPEGFSMRSDQRVSKAGALKLFDWLGERIASEEEE